MVTNFQPIRIWAGSAADTKSAANKTACSCAQLLRAVLLGCRVKPMFLRLGKLTVRMPSGLHSHSIALRGRSTSWQLRFRDVPTPLRRTVPRESNLRRATFLPPRGFFPSIHVAGGSCSTSSGVSLCCSTHALAMPTADVRTLAITPTRSVTDIAPRASRILKRCEHLRQRS